MSSHNATETKQLPNANEIVFFWKQYGQHGYLTNWYSHTGFNGAKQGKRTHYYYNTEQWMMYWKACLFKDNEIATQILKTSDPKTIKALGRQVKGFRWEVWEQNARSIVYEGCLLKFSQNPSLKRLLLSTGDKLLVEASPYDKLWGIGLDEYTALKTPKPEWPGKNWLGICLMAIRDHLRNSKPD